jgi:pimeloyl-ACP methyl ester carboxylesterase
MAGWTYIKAMRTCWKTVLKPAMALVLVAAGTSIFAHDSPKFVEVADGVKLRLRIDGHGSSHVVLVGGLGDTLDIWSAVAPLVGEFATVMSYDRAGLGESGPSKTERSYENAASELHAALSAAKVEPPYILVGHSLGAAIIRTFASRYNAEVTALVFVDPMSEDIANSPDAREALAHEGDMEMAGAPEGVRAEWTFLRQELLDNFAQLRAIAVPDKPMALLIARNDRPQAWEDTLLRQYGKWVLARKDSTLILTADSGHYIHREQPALVASAIRQVIFPSPARVIRQVIAARGTAAAVKLFREMRSRYRSTDITVDTLLAAGFEQLRTKNTEAAIQLFKLNIETFPANADAYDALAQAYESSGDIAAAIGEYQKALAVNARDPFALEGIKRLKK